MSKNAIGAENQQATPTRVGESSETTRQTPLKKLEILAYLHGAMHDASLNKRTRIRFVQKYPQWLEKLQILLKKIGYNSWIYKEGKNRNLYTLETTCKELDFSFDPMSLKTDKEKAMYLRGFFDAEGGIPRNNKIFYVQLVQKNQNKMTSVRNLLSDLGIATGKLHNPSRRVDPDYWRLFVSTKHHRLFAKTIGSWHPVKAKIFSERMKI
ncbi:MAG: LAGLIDADG family homing endonuclease [Candidatus Harrisonbacteria bacterium]|nr:LAGLIDADG family homing endonuclease [Candidatus Harrisonbacteria bacterium]